MSRRRRKPMEFLRHPTRTRAFLLQLLVFLVAAALGYLSKQTTGEVSQALKWSGIGLFVLMVLYIALFTNVTHCPQCRRRLTRRRRETDFICRECQVVWQTYDRTN